jgi:molecular chaperone GrpE
VSDTEQGDVNPEARPPSGDGDPHIGGGANGEGRLAVVEAERDEMKDRMLRIAADFENWKKRARKEQDEGEAKVRESVLKDILDVMDNLERAVSAYGPTEAGTARAGTVDGSAILKGVGLVLRLFQSKLERYGVKPIEARGQPFDPRIHEAISRIESVDIPSGSVAAELQRGYRIGDRLLRPSLVSVSAGPTDGRSGEGGQGGGVGDKGA